MYLGPNAINEDARAGAGTSTFDSFESSTSDAELHVLAKPQRTRIVVLDVVCIDTVDFGLSPCLVLVSRQYPGRSEGLAR